MSHSQNSALRVAFAGTPEFAAVALSRIIDEGFEIPLVLTQPDRPAGRGMKLKASAVKQVAQQHHIPVEQPERLKSAQQQAPLRECCPDVLVVAAYGLLLPKAVLDIPRLGCINIHASLLPRWRGAAPIHRAIEAGDRQTGITLMQMDEGLDTGNVLAMSAINIAEDDTTIQLHDKLAVLGGDMLVNLLSHFSAGETVASKPQSATGATYANKISKAEAVIDWYDSAERIARRIRAFNPFPGAVTTLNNETVKIWMACCAESQSIVAAEHLPGQILDITPTDILVGCGQGVLRIHSLQKAGAKKLMVEEFLRGFPVHIGARFGFACT